MLNVKVMFCMHYFNATSSMGTEQSAKGSLAWWNCYFWHWILCMALGKGSNYRYQKSSLLHGKAHNSLSLLFFRSLTVH